jgi:hypothetical protein
MHLYPYPQLQINPLDDRRIKGQHLCLGEVIDIGIHKKVTRENNLRSKSILCSQKFKNPSF